MRYGIHWLPLAFRLILFVGCKAIAATRNMYYYRLPVKKPAFFSIFERYVPIVQPVITV
jgi:hypothetical protein